MLDREVRRTVWWEDTTCRCNSVYSALPHLYGRTGKDTGEVAEMMKLRLVLEMTTSLTLPDGTIVYFKFESSLSYPFPALMEISVK